MEVCRGVGPAHPRSTPRPFWRTARAELVPCRSGRARRTVVVSVPESVDPGSGWGRSDTTRRGVGPLRRAQVPYWTEVSYVVRGDHSDPLEIPGEDRPLWSLGHDPIRVAPRKSLG